jgi:hypothetical protein
MIEVTHDIDKLPIRRAYRVWNAANAYKRLQRFTEAKRPRGLRVRYAEDRGNNTLRLETRNSEAMRVVTGFLRRAGLVEKEISF